MSAHTPTHPTLVSLAMPAYNVAPFIEEAIRSVQAQTHTYWELIIVDDCSTDDTCLRIPTDDPRIRLVRRQTNSGGPRLPRLDAVLEARGQYIIYLDADDALEPTYIETLLERQRTTGADTVMSQLVLADERLQPTQRTIPASPFDWEQVSPSRDVARLTVGGWKVSVSGQLVPADVFKQYAREAYDAETVSSFTDEVDCRQVLMRCKKVAFAPARYLYRQQPESIVHWNNARAILRLRAYELLWSFVCQHYEACDPLRTQAANECLEGVYRLAVACIKHRWGAQHIKTLRKAHAWVSQLPSQTSLKLRLAKRHWLLMRAIATLAAKA